MVIKMSNGLNQAEMEYFEENLGSMSFRTLAKNLGKQPRSLDAYRSRKGLPNTRSAVDGISISDFAAAVNVDAKTIYKYWIKDNSLPVKHCFVGTNGNKELFVDLIKFWLWAEEHKRFIDFSKIEPGIFGKEPVWVKEIRHMDMTDWGKKGWNKIWTPEEDLKLHNILRLQRYTYREISDLMRRSELGIQNRLYVTGEKLRPVEEPRKEWTDDEEQKLIKLITDGYSAFQISRRLDRSEISVETKVGRLKSNGK